MIKLLIINACLNFNLVTPDNFKITITEAKILQRGAEVCKSHYKGCLSFAELKVQTNGKHFNILCDQRETIKTAPKIDFNKMGGRI